MAVLGAGYLLTTAKYADIDTSQKRDNANLVPFDYEYSYSQTIIPTTKNLCLIEFFIASAGLPKNYRFSVFAELTDDYGRRIASQQYKISNSAVIDTLTLSFKPQWDSLNKRYRLYLRTDAPPNVVALLRSDYDSYPRGDLVSGGLVVKDGDLAFFTYNKPAITSLLQKTLSGSGRRIINLLLITIFFAGLGLMLTIFVIPGQEPIQWTITTVLAGVAAAPILLSIFSLFHIRFETHMVSAIRIILIAIGIAGLLLLFRNLRTKRVGTFQWMELLAFSLLLLLAMTTRLIQIDGLMIPNGIDSQFHENAIERIAEKGSLPLDSIYHLGFHSNTVFIQKLTGNSIPETMLLYGQWLSIFTGLSFYLLARAFFEDWRYALVATSFYWFVSPMPAYLMNIGRYPFLQGFVLLPWAAELIWNNRKHHAANEPLIVAAIAGLFLSHYGSTAMILVPVLGYILSELKDRHRLELPSWQNARFASVWGVLILIAFTKLYYVVSQGGWESFLTSPTTLLDDSRYVFSHTLRHGGFSLWLLGAMGGILFFRRHRILLIVSILCVVSLLAMEWLQMILLGHSATHPTNTLFALAIPLSLFSGLTMQYLFRGRDTAAALSMLILTVAAAYNMSGIINPRNVFFTTADQNAMEWIESHVPQKSLIVINSFSWGDHIGPTDAGFWISNMTGRSTTFARTSEEYEQIEDFIRLSKADYVYIGSGYGNITPLVMRKLHKKLVHEEDGIYIYSLKE
jgi:hypothetical protein